MDHPKAIGDRSALAAVLGLEAAGWSVYLPFGEKTRSDFVIDDGQQLARVQCKTGR
jgi:PD-(D/E)XK nuclease superfamily protein